MWKKVTAVVLCLIFAALLLSSCGKSSKSFALPLEKPATSCDPQIADGNGLRSIANNTFEGLVRLDRDGRPIPGAASSWTISGGGTIYTFHLRQGQKWHLTDGMEDILGKSYKKTFSTAVTADDFVFGLQRAVASSTDSPMAASLFCILNAEAIHAGATPSALGVRSLGPYTVQIQLEWPNANFLAALASAPAMPCNRSFFHATAGRYCLDGDLALCNGPYYVSSINSTTGGVLLKKNPDYQGEYPALADSLSFVYADDLGGVGSGSSTEPEQQESTNGDPVPVDILTSIQSESGLSAGVVDADEVTNLPRKYKTTSYENQVKLLCFNQKSKLAKNGSLRMALACATDVTAIGDIASRAPSGIIPDGSMTTAGKNYRRSAGYVVLGKPDLNKAKKYFAGIKALQDSEEENKGTVYGDTPDTLNITLICLANDRGAAQSLVQNWQKIFGTTLSVTVKTYPNQLKLNSALEKGKYDIAYTSYRTDDAYAVNFLDTFTGTSSANFIGLNDPAYNALVAKARTASMDGSIAACCKEAERYLIQKGYIIPIRQESSSLVSNKGAKDIFADPAGAVLSAFILEEEK